jgi:hypothetical protein
MLIKDDRKALGVDFVTEGSVKGEEKWQARFYSRWITPVVP